jgi:transposase
VLEAHWDHLITQRRTTAMSITHLPRTKGKRIALGDGEKLHVGIDVHKSTCHLTLWSPARGLVTDWVAAADTPALVRSFAAMRPHIERIVYEAGPTGFTLARALRAAGLRADVVAPGHTPLTPVRGAKCDRLDSRNLACLSAKGLLHPVRVPTEREEAERQVPRLRQQALRRLQRIKQQIKSFLLLHGVAAPRGLSHWSQASVRALRALALGEDLRFCLDEMLEAMAQAHLAVMRATHRLREIARRDHHAETVARLRTVPGVGPLTSLTFRLEMPEPERFGDAGQVARLCGLAPGVHQSGQTRRAGPLMRGGNAWLRTALVEASWLWVRGDPGARRVHRRLVRNTGSSKKAICGVARRLAIVLWRLSVTGEAYRVAA